MDDVKDLANAEGEQFARWEQRIESLIRAKGGAASAREFQREVNIIFHDVEATRYDELHREMWDSLQPLYDLLATDIQRSSPDATDWTLADVGCGTGLATQFILQTPLKARISKLMMVDTSSVMLTKCQTRAATWGIPAEFINNHSDALPEASVDLLVTCSVLHHIPNLVSFCQQIRRIVRPGGFYLHIQDPRRGAGACAILNQRTGILRSARNGHRSRLLSLPRRAFRFGIRRFQQLVKLDQANNYLAEVNRRLIESKLIKKPLSPCEIWSITDLRVGDLPYAAVDGICTDELAIALGSFDRVAKRSYGFFGVMPSHLPPSFLEDERRLMDEGSGDGAYLSGIWRRRS